MDQLLLPILMFAALGAMMYFGMRKQKRQVAQTRQMQDSVVPGARVMTTSGLHGEVTAVADDTIELEIAPGIRTTWVRAAVREIVVPTTAPSLEDSLDADGVSTDGLSETGEVSLDKRQSGSTDIG